MHKADKTHSYNHASHTEGVLFSYLYPIDRTPSKIPPEPKAQKLVNVTNEPSTSRHNAPTTKHKRKETKICMFSTLHVNIVM